MRILRMEDEKGVVKMASPKVQKQLEEQGFKVVEEVHVKPGQPMPMPKRTVASTVKKALANPEE